MSGRRGEGGSALLLLPLLIWLSTMVAVVVIDLGGYFVAAARAQQLADAAALAAVDVGAGAPGAESTLRVRRLVASGGGELVRHVGDPGRGYALVEVAVPVPGLVLPSLGAAEVTARSEAVSAGDDLRRSPEGSG